MREGGEEEKEDAFRKGKEEGRGRRLKEKMKEKRINSIKKERETIKKGRSVKQVQLGWSRVPR